MLMSLFCQKVGPTPAWLQFVRLQLPLFLQHSRIALRHRAWWYWWSWMSVPHLFGAPELFCKHGSLGASVSCVRASLFREQNGGTCSGVCGPVLHVDLCVTDRGITGWCAVSSSQCIVRRWRSAGGTAGVGSGCPFGLIAPVLNIKYSSVLALKKHKIKIQLISHCQTCNKMSEISRKLVASLLQKKEHCIYFFLCVCVCVCVR